VDHQCSVAGCDRAFHAACAYTATPEYCLRAHMTHSGRTTVQFEAFCSEHSHLGQTVPGNSSGRGSGSSSAVDGRRASTHGVHGRRVGGANKPAAVAAAATAATAGGSAVTSGEGDVPAGLPTSALDPLHDHLRQPIVCCARPSPTQVIDTNTRHLSHICTVLIAGDVGIVPRTLSGDRRRSPVSPRARNPTPYTTTGPRRGPGEAGCCCGAHRSL
jgi:hypothetical protein